MSDIADDAQHSIDLQLRLSLLAHRQRRGDAPETDSDGNRICVDCSAIIPVKRVKAVDAIRCVDCQTHCEKQQQMRG